MSVSGVSSICFCLGFHIVLQGSRSRGLFSADSGNRENVLPSGKSLEGIPSNFWGGGPGVEVPLLCKARWDGIFQVDVGEPMST